MSRIQLYRWAERAAAELRRECSQEAPPIDVRELAWALGVSEIRTRPTVADGRLEYQPGRQVIVVDTRAAPARQRFTIAHELGHLWLGRAESRALDLDPAARERFCDAFAAALLLPNDWISERARGSAAGLLELRSISEEASVSMASCLIRLQRYPQWRRALIHWRWESGGWRQWSVAGLDAVMRDQIASVERTERAITVLAHHEAGVYGCRIWLGVGPHEQLLDAEILVEGSRAIALVEVAAPSRRGAPAGRFGELPPRRIKSRRRAPLV